MADPVVQPVPDCFARVGMRIPRTRGGKCYCGAKVRFDIGSKRIEHFMVCPVVDKRVRKAQSSIEFDLEAVGRGLAMLTQAASG